MSCFSTIKCATKVQCLHDTMCACVVFVTGQISNTDQFRITLTLLMREGVHLYNELCTCENDKDGL